MNEYYILEYSVIVLSSLLALLLSFIFISLSYILVYQVSTKDKISAYECGFEAFEPARERFDVHFYIVGILFIIFDLEIIFLVPFVTAIKGLGLFGFISVIGFLFLITLGFIYEWVNKALNWPR